MKAFALTVRRWVAAALLGVVAVGALPTAAQADGVTELVRTLSLLDERVAELENQAEAAHNEAVKLQARAEEAEQVRRQWEEVRRNAAAKVAGLGAGLSDIGQFESLAAAWEEALANSEQAARAADAARQAAADKSDEAARKETHRETLLVERVHLEELLTLERELVIAQAARRQELMAQRDLLRSTSSSATYRPPEGTTGVEQWRPLVERYFPRDLWDEAMRVMACESNGRSDAVNPTSGATGLFQFLEKTWVWVSREIGLPGADRTDPVANVRAAAWLVAYSQRTNHPKGRWGHWECQP